MTTSTSTHSISFAMALAVDSTRNWMQHCRGRLAIWRWWSARLIPSRSAPLAAAPAAKPPHHASQSNWRAFALYTPPLHVARYITREDELGYFEWRRLVSRGYDCDIEATRGNYERSDECGHFVEYWDFDYSDRGGGYWAVCVNYDFGGLTCSRIGGYFHLSADLVA